MAGHEAQVGETRNLHRILLESNTKKTETEERNIRK